MELLVCVPHDDLDEFHPLGYMMSPLQIRGGNVRTSPACLINQHSPNSLHLLASD